MQRADLHGRAQDVLKRKLNVTLPELEMPEVLSCCVAVDSIAGGQLPTLGRVLHAWGGSSPAGCQALVICLHADGICCCCRCCLT